MKPDSQLNIICLETDAFYALVNNVVERIKEEQGFQNQQILRWSDFETGSQEGTASILGMKIKFMADFLFARGIEVFPKR